MTRKVRKVGFSEEDDSKLDCSTQYDVEELVRYLEAGVPYVLCPGLEDDRRNPNAGVRLFKHILTDGIWAWPESYAYYIRTYKLPVPKEFLNTTSTNKTPFKVDIFDLSF